MNKSKPKEFSKEIEVDIERLASSHSEQNKETNRRWSTAAILSLIALSTGLNPVEQSVFGVKVPPELQQPILILILSVVNFVYCVSHINGYRTAAMLRDICAKEELGTKSVVGDFTKQDYVYMQMASNFNRISPLFMEKKRRILQKITKLIVDTTQFLLAPFAIIFLYANFEFSNNFHFLLIPPSFLSIFVSSVLWVNSLRHIKSI